MFLLPCLRTHLIKPKWALLETYPQAGSDITIDRCVLQPYPADPQPQHDIGQMADKTLWDELVSSRKMPTVLHKAIKTAWDYRDNPDAIRPLSRVTQLSKSEEARTGRQNRRDGRIAESWVLLSLLMNTDLTTLMVGYPKSGKFVHRSCVDLAQMVGKSDTNGKPSKSFKRAYKRLQDAALLTQKRVADERADGSIYQKASVKSINRDLVVMLIGGTKKAEAMLAKARGEASQYRKKNTEATPQAKPVIDEAAERAALADAMEAKATTKKAPTPKPAPCPLETPVIPMTAVGITEAQAQSIYNLGKDKHMKETLKATGGNMKAGLEAMKAYPSFSDWRRSVGV